MTIETRVLRSDAFKLTGESRTLSGHASVFDSDSEVLAGMFVERVAPGAFDRSLQGKADVVALINHDQNMLLGRTASGTLRLGKDAKGLTVDLDLPDTTLGRDVATMVGRGDMRGMSIGFRVLRDRWVSRGASVDGASYDLRIVEDVELFDVSAVTTPAYPATDLAVRSHSAWVASGKAQEKAANTDTAQRRQRQAEATL